MVDHGERSDRVTLTIDGRATEVAADVTVAAALRTAGLLAPRRSPRGEMRAPLCGMGICFECRVTIDGRAHQRACRVPVRDGMHVDSTHVDSPDASAGLRTEGRDA